MIDVLTRPRNLNNLYKVSFWFSNSCLLWHTLGGTGEGERCILY